MEITSEQQEEAEIEREGRIYLLDGSRMDKNKRKLKDEMREREEKIILMREKKIIFNPGPFYLQRNR